MSKIQFWKQFTTTTCTFYPQACCIRYVKDTILKAIYNSKAPHGRPSPAVFDMSKIQFWKQFTTVRKVLQGQRWLYSICQRYNFESNLQHSNTAVVSYCCCIRYVKDTILKAIYNDFENVSKICLAVFDMSKIQFWKQFTTLTFIVHMSLSCIRYVKDTILKAIYNILVLIMAGRIAVFDMSKIQFWKQFTTPEIEDKIFL